MVLRKSAIAFLLGAALAGSGVSLLATAAVPGAEIPGGVYVPGMPAPYETQIPGLERRSPQERERTERAVNPYDRIIPNRDAPNQQLRAVPYLEGEILRFDERGFPLNPERGVTQFDERGFPLDGSNGVTQFDERGFPVGAGNVIGIDSSDSCQLRPANNTVAARGECTMNRSCIVQERTTNSAVAWKDSIGNPTPRQNNLEYRAFCKR
jgi:hypothetical protein